jgi:hypothetical protein
MNERLGGIVEIRARIGFVHGPLCAVRVFSVIQFFIP